MSSAESSGSLPLIDVCVASYRRPEGLRRLLRSLAGQETGGKFTFAVRVADNDVNRTAEPVVREFAAEGLAISYEVEPVQNVSCARNRSLSMAKGEYIASIDDDIYAGPRWLLTLYEAAVAHGADAVQGRLVPEFQPGTREYLKSFFVPPNPPAGSTQDYVYDTANCFFRRSLVEGIAEPYEVRLGRSGGEDTAFFEGLRDAGHKLIWWPEAVAYYPVPANRATIRWLVRRTFRFGNSPRLPLTGKRLVSTVRALTTLGAVTAVYFAAGLFSAPFREKALNRSVLFLRVLSKLVGGIARKAGHAYEEYKGH